jgi:hypothetical protein
MSTGKGRPEAAFQTAGADVDTTITSSRVNTPDVPAEPMTRGDRTQLEKLAKARQGSQRRTSRSAERAAARRRESPTVGRVHDRP